MYFPVYLKKNISLSEMHILSFFPMSFQSFSFKYIENAAR